MLHVLANTFTNYVDDWVVWMIIAVIFLVIELLTINLVSIWFVAGAMVASFLAGYNQSFKSQLIALAVVSFIGVVLFWRFRDKLKISASTIVTTNADRIIGKEAVVIQNINSVENTGLIRVLGQVWSATTEDDVVIASGSRVVVISLKGVKAVVEIKK